MPMPRPSLTLSDFTDGGFADVIVSRAPPNPGEEVVPLCVQAADREVFFEELDAKLKVHHKELVDSFSQQLEGVRGVLMDRLEEHGTQLLAHQEKLSGTLTGAWDEKLQTAQGKILQSLETLQPMFPRSVIGATQNRENKAVVETPLEEETNGEDRQPGLASFGLQMPFHPTRDNISRCDVEAVDDQAKRQAFSVGIKQKRTTITVENGKYSISVADIVASHVFEMFFTVVIFFNAIIIGIQTDLATRGESGDQDMRFFAINTGFTALFTGELAMRLYVKGWDFFWRSSSLHWNYLDLVVVVVSLLEAALDIVVLFADSESLQAAQDTSQFRVIRILRLTRLVRGLRITRIVRFVRALRTLVYQICFTIKSMVWALFLLTIILYLFAVVFTQGITTYRAEQGLDLDVQIVSDGDPLLRYWATLPRSMLTLFMSITNGVDWEDVVRPLSRMHGSWVVIFVAYICFTQMAVLNVITGFFCQNAIEGAKLDQDIVTQTILAQKKMYLEQISAIFATMDADGSGSITIQEFEDHLNSETTKAYFESLGVDASDVWTLFKLMDMDNGCQIELEEFVSGCMRLKGGAKGLDVAKLAYEHRFMCKQIAKFMQRTDDRLGYILGDEGHQNYRACDDE